MDVKDFDELQNDLVKISPSDLAERWMFEVDLFRYFFTNETIAFIERNLPPKKIVLENLRELLDIDYTGSDTEDDSINMLNSLLAFWMFYGVRRPQSEITERIKFSTLKVIRCCSGTQSFIFQHWSRESFRTEKSSKSKTDRMQERMRRAFEIDDQLHDKYTRHGAANEILKRWDPQKYGTITTRTITIYLEEAGRRKPKK